MGKKCLPEMLITQSRLVGKESIHIPGHPKRPPRQAVHREFTVLSKDCPKGLEMTSERKQRRQKGRQTAFRPLGDSTARTVAFTQRLGSSGF